MATSVGSLTIEMAANIARLQKDMDAAKNTVAGAMAQIQKSVSFATKALGLLGVGLGVSAMAGYIKNAINAADETAKLAQKIGVATKDVAGLQLAFRQSGLGAGELQMAMSKLSVGIANGNMALTAMGVATKNADGSLRSTREVLGEVADRFASYQDGAAKSALAIELFGKSGAALIPLLNGGSEALDSFDQMAQKLGLTLDDKTAKAAEAFNDTLDLIKAAGEGVATQVAAQLLPTLQSLAGSFFNALTEGDRLAKISQVLGVTLKALGSVVIVLVEAVLTAATAIKTLGSAMLSIIQGDFKGALNAFSKGGDEVKKSWGETLDNLKGLWTETGDASVASMAATMGAIKKLAPSIKDLEEAQKRAAQEMAEAAKRNNEEFDKYFDSIEKVRLAQENGIKKAREMVEQIEFEAEALKMTNEEREVAIKLRQLELNGLEKGSAAYEEMANRIREAMVGKQAIQKAIDEQKKLEDEWKKTSENIEKSLTDALMRAFEDGKGFAQSFKDTLINMFKTMILRPIIQAIVQPVGGAVLGALGMGAAGTAQAAGTAGGGLSGATGVLGAINAASSAFGVGAAASFNSIMAAGVSGWATAAGSLIGTGSLAGIAAGVGMFAAPILAIAGIAKLFGGRSNTEAGAGALATTRDVSLSANDYALANRFVSGSALGDLTARFNPQIQPIAESIANAVVSSTTAQAKAIGKEIAIGLDTGLAWDPKDVATYGYAALYFGEEMITTYANRALGKTFEEGAQKFTQELMELTAKAILDGSGVVIKEGQTAASTLEAMATNITIVNRVFDNLNVKLLDVSVIGAQAASQIIEMFGGVENFVQSTSFYLENFYSQTERADIVTRQLTSAMQGLGLVVPKTREEFRALVEAQDLTTETGRQTYAALLQLAPAFANVVAESNSLSAAVQEVAVQMRSATDIANERNRLETKLLQLQGDTNALRNREREALDESNRSLLDQIYALEDKIETDKISAQLAQESLRIQEQQAAESLRIQEQQAAEAARLAQEFASEQQRIQREIEAKRERVLNERLSLERQLLNILGDTAAIRKIELKTLDPSNRALQLRIWALEDAAIAEEKAAKYQEELAQKQQIITDQRISLEKKLLELQGGAAKIREMELDALDPSNRGLQLQIWALEDAKQAQDKYRQTLENTTKSIADEIDRLRGTKATKQSLSVLQTQFAIATAQARSGDLIAAQNLPELSRSISELVASTAGSSLDVIRSNSRLAGSLSQTLTALNYSSVGGVEPIMNNLEIGYSGGEISYSTPTVMSQGDAALEIRALREENKIQASNLVNLQTKMNKLLDRWDADGLPETRILA